MRYFFIGLLVLSVAAYVQLRPQCSSCSRRSNVLNTAVAKMTAIDNDIYKVLVLFKDIVPEETISEDCYKLVYYLPHMQGNFEVRVKHRVIAVMGHDPKTQGCDATFVDLRILPDFVDAHEGTFDFSGGYLTVQFPYKYNLEESEGGCNSMRIDSTEIHLRRS